MLPSDRMRRVATAPQPQVREDTTLKSRSYLCKCELTLTKSQSFAQIVNVAIEEEEFQAVTSSVDFIMAAHPDEVRTTKTKLLLCLFAI